MQGVLRSDLFRGCRMALKARYDSLEDVPEDVRQYYVESDGAYELDVDGVVPKAKLDEFRDNNIRLKKELERMEGVDPERYQALLAEQKKREREDAERRGEYERLLGETKEEYEQRIAAKDELLAKRDAQLKQILRDQAVSAELDRAGIRAGLKSVALPYMERYVRTEERDGEVRTVVVDADGKPRLNKNGDEMALADFVAEFRESEAGAALFEGTVGRGSGATGSAGRGAGGAQKKLTEMTTAEKVALIAKARESGSPNPGRVLLDLPH